MLLLSELTDITLWFKKKLVSVKTPFNYQTSVYDFALFPTIDLTGGCLVHPFEILRIIWEFQTDVQSEPLDFWGCNFIHWLSVNFCDSHLKILQCSFIIGEKISPLGNEKVDGILWFQTNFLLRTLWKLSKRLLDSVTAARMWNERKLGITSLNNSS